MKFSAFTKSTSGNTILFENLYSIKDIKSIKYYRDDSSGSFSKKEIRWSFNNEYWSSWENLSQGKISEINVTGKYLWINVRYTLSSVSSGSVSSFYIEYSILPANEQLSGSTDACSTIFKTKIVTSEITNAQTLCDQPSEFYLWRPNHKGTQPITSITDLQKVLNNLTSAVQNVDIKSVSNVDQPGIGVYFNTQDKIIYFKTLFSQTEQLNISESLNGQISLDFQDRFVMEGSLGPGLEWAPDGQLYVDASVAGVNKFYVDVSLMARDASINTIWDYIIDLSTIITCLDGSIESLTILTDDLSTRVWDLESSVGTLDSLIQTNIINISILDSSIETLDGSIIELYELVGDTSVQGASNIGDGSAGVYAGLSIDGSLQFREFIGIGDATVTQNGDLIEISLDSSFGSYASIEYVDGSLAVRDIGIAQLDASIVRIDVSLNDIKEASDVFYYKSYIDGSFGTRDIEIAQLDASIVRIDAYNVIQDASIAAYEANDVTFAYVDGSLATRDIEIAQLDASIVRIDAYQVIQDVSITLKADLTYVDASLITRDIEIAQLDASVVRIDVSLNDVVDGEDLYYEKTYIDGSLSQLDASITANLIENIRNDGSINVAFSNIATNSLSITTNKSSSDASIVRIDNYDIIQDASIILINSEITQLDASVVRIDASISNIDAILTEAGATLAYIDGSLNLKTNKTYSTIQDVSILRLDGSVSYLFDNYSSKTYSTIQDASILANTNDIIQLDASVVRIDSSLNDIKDAADVFYYKAYIDGSLNTKANLTYIDGSLALRDIEIAQLDASIVRIDVSLNDVVDGEDLYYEKTYIDGSFGTRDTEIAHLDASIVRIDSYQIIQDVSISSLTPTILLLNNNYELISPSITQIEYIIKNVSTNDVSIYTDGTYQIDNINDWTMSSMNTMHLISYDVSNWYII